MSDASHRRLRHGRCSRSPAPKARSTRSRTSCSASPARRGATTSCATRSPTSRSRPPSARRSSRTCSAARRRRPPSQLVSMVVGSGRGRDLPAIVDRLVAAGRRARKDLEVAEVRSRRRRSTDDQQDRLAGRARPTPPASRSSSRSSSTRPCSAASSPPSATPSSTAPSAPASTSSRPGSRPRKDRTPWLSSPSPPPTSPRRSRRTSTASSRRSRPAPSAASPRSATASPASSGLPDAAVNELLEFEDGTVGLALNLDEDSIGAVVLGDVDDIEEGQTVKATGRILSVPVGDGVLGRVVNALGEPIDGKGELAGVQPRRMEIQAPGIMGRKPVHEPLQTGIKAIDAMTPIGRGQRELIIGDRKTGKTTVAIDTILNQKGQGVKCIYVAIGQKGSTVAQTVETLRQHGAMEYTVVVVAPGRRPGAVQVPRPLRRLRHGPALDGERRARPRRLRRPVEAGRGLPPGVAAAAPPAGPRGVPRRRLLPPQPPARAGRQAVRRERRRLADRAADHRDQGRRRLGVHPDQRDLDHRRPGLPAGRPVQVGRPPGRRRRHLGVPRGRRRADQGDEGGRRHAQARPRPVPRARGVRHVRLRARRGVEGPARARLPPGRAAQAAAQLARCRSRSRSSSIFAGTNGYLDDLPVADVRASRPSCSSYMRTRHGDAARRASRDPATLPDGARPSAVDDVQGRVPGRRRPTPAARSTRPPPTPTSSATPSSDKTLATE